MELALLKKKIEELRENLPLNDSVNNDDDDFGSYGLIGYDAALRDIEKEIKKIESKEKIVTPRFEHYVEIANFKHTGLQIFIWQDLENGMKHFNHSKDNGLVSSGMILKLDAYGCVNVVEKWN